jgi:hypothetical protein
MQTAATPDDPWTRAMRASDFEAAWRISDRVLARRVARGERCFHAPRHLQFIWRGQPLRGRVLVRCYHGLGDTLQFVRFAWRLKRVARETVFWVQAPLLELVASVPGVDRVLPLHDAQPDIPYDADIEIMELPHALRVQAAELAADFPYLDVGPRDNGGRSGERDTARGPRFRVGVAWIAGSWNAARSLRAAQLAPLASLAGVELVSLQFDPPPDDTIDGAEDLACENVAVMARRMRDLDLVVSVDSMIAHLAGGMGLPTWTLLPADCDWRWMAAPDRTPWYPQMRLYRQEIAGDWRAPIARLCADLAARVDQG